MMKKLGRHLVKRGQQFLVYLLPHVLEAAHGIFSDILIRVVEVQELQSVSWTKLRPNLKQCLQLSGTCSKLIC